MKTLIKSLALALTLGFVTSVASFADVNPGGRPSAIASYQSGIYTSVDGKLNICLDKQIGGPVDVSLKGSDGKVFYAQHLGKKESKYRTRLNLEELPDGVYQVEITNGVETTTHNVTISTQKAETPNRLIAIK
ncbi:T9SS type A sorting domain-containing protein [Spirosoma pollinicola]|uniref:Secretion system C-terminal sorting domain-containing protein n=1 Tax=Spirosoma pollinicola TaxID=2057025 RepID=A0A2K8Z5R3_9BACT|nr:hypothetical protein [Spirosoma pollinicola]AUD05159.1 hypothetical protein CWM47_26920 [Spirosoma pollinicola]